MIAGGIAPVGPTKNDLQSGGLTPLSIRPANDMGEITKNYACNQSGVKPPHSKILAAHLLN
jgi:hypothetical protein